VNRGTIAQVVVGYVLVACLFGPALAETADKTSQTVVAQGIATVIQDNVPAARDTAVQDALRQAVEQAAGTVVEADTLVQNFQLVSTSVYTKTAGYVQSYTVVREWQEGTLYKVSIRAVVDMGTLEKDLGALGLLYQRIKKPRVMVIILETQRGIRSVDSAAEAEMIRKLVQSGFTVMDQRQIQAIRASDQVKKLVGGDLKAAQLLGRQHGTELLIVGEGASEGAIRGGPLANFVSVRARVEARAIRTDTGDILAAEGVSAPGLDLSEQGAGKKALAAAGEKWVEAALPAILARWSKEVNDGNTVQVVVSGLTFAQLGKFKERLKTEVRGVKDIHQRSFTANVATLDVDVKGSAQELADDIVRKDFPSFKIEVVGFSPNRLDLLVVSQ